MSIDPDPVLDVAIVIPVFNQWTYTRNCLKGVLESGAMPRALVVIDNGSTDGTADLLIPYRRVRIIRNSKNHGCATAWNQGLRETRSMWVAFLNNDVVVSPDWLRGLLECAEAERLDIVSPAMREGLLDYDLRSFSEGFVQRTWSQMRRGVANGACFLVRRAVFGTVGLFDENFRFGQYEDEDFFRRAKLAGFRLATTGRAFVHHYGSVTQTAMRESAQMPPYEEWNRAYFRQKWSFTWPKRFAFRWKAMGYSMVWRAQEKLLCGHTLHERRDPLPRAPQAEGP